MAHSEKTMTFATDLVPQEDSIYNLGYSDQRWKIYGELQPLATKIYTAKVYGADGSGTCFYQNFMTITPADYNAIWTVTYRVTVTADGHSDYTATYDEKISGRSNTYYSWYSYNSLVNYPIYQHMLLNSSNANTPHEIGIRMASSYGDTTVVKKIQVDLLETYNCTAVLLNNLKYYTSATPSGFVWRGWNATSNGMQESGDSNDTGIYIYSNGFKGKAGSNKVYRYCLFARTGDGTYESFVMQDNTVATTKTVNPHGFVPDGKIYWNSNNAVYNEGTLNLSVYEQYHVIDYRYSFNFNNTFLPDYCETYVVYTYNEDDGLLYLDTTQWLAAALPTTADGKIYQRIGSKYYTGTGNYYQGSLLLDNPYYEFKNGKIRTWAPSTRSIKSITRSGTTFTATRDNGSTFTFTQQDNNTTYTFENGTNGFKVTPLGGTAQTVTVTPSVAWTNVSGRPTNLNQFTNGPGYVTSSGVTSVAAGVGLTGGTITGTGTIKAKLKSETAHTADSASLTNTANRQYAVGIDKSGYLSVNVPWTDTDTDTKNTAGSTNSDSKLYLIGATSQTANSQTYSDAHVFETNGTFSAKTLGVNADTDNNKVTLQWNSIDNSLDFIFA